MIDIQKRSLVRLAALGGVAAATALVAGCGTK